jgi:hypothetical protein
VVLAKVVLEIVALTTPNRPIVEAMRVAVNALNVTFPPLALGTIVSGVLLSLGTKWGLLKHTWIVAKIVLTVGVIATAVQLIDRFAQAETGITMGLLVSPSQLRLGLSAVHLLMLLVATIISVYKPWGRTWFYRRTAGQARRAQPHTGSLPP